VHSTTSIALSGGTGHKENPGVREFLEKLFLEFLDKIKAIHLRHFYIYKNARKTLIITFQKRQSIPRPILNVIFFDIGQIPDKEIYQIVGITVIIYQENIHNLKSLKYM